mmetsp:Transcript_29944/g.61572  ORF Transcript_29944/g.61572 Transcript_29944/m.61572 type:complete len:247 (+) Transcript_29944:34-774(+)
MLRSHRFCQRLSRDLHPFGCYVIGRLPREHPEVIDTTHSDRGLEGAFLGWDLHTPTVWLWSFRKKKAIRMHDPVFYNTRFPFKNPDILLNRDLTLAEVREMHAVDLETGETATGEDAVMEADDDEYSTPPTQPMHPTPQPTKPAPAAAAPPNTRSRSPTPTPDTPESPPAPAPAATARPNTRSRSSTPPPDPSVNHRDVRTWVRGSDIPLDASLRLLSDKQLGRALAHHKLVLQLPLCPASVECRR